MNGSSYSLKHLTDAELLESLTRLCQRSNQLEAELLAHLAEVEARRLHVVQGFSSVFAYCLSRLGHTEDEAGRRIHAARAARRFPELLPMLACGDMHLSTINLIAARFGDDDENAKGLIAAARGKTKREVELMLAARFQKPDAPTRLVPLANTPAAAKGTVKADADAALPLFVARATAPATPPPAKVATPEGEAQACATATCPASQPASPLPPAAPNADEPIARFRLQVTISREARDHLVHAQALLAHSIADGDVGRVLERALVLLCHELEAKKFGKLKRHAATPAAPRSSESTAAAPNGDGAHAPAAELSVPGRTDAMSSSTNVPAAPDAPPPAGGGATKRERRGKGGTRPRTIPRAVRRQVAERDGYRCSYISPDGVRCYETRRLEFNHKTPFARGGEATVDSINLLCRVHNDLQARRDFGEAHMQAARRRAERAESGAPAAGPGMTARRPAGPA